MGTGGTKRELAREFKGELPLGVSASAAFAVLPCYGTAYENDKDLGEQLYDGRCFQRLAG
ncbi:MAG: hypothetical protein KF831_01230 [Acidobacteria bacterium]|nr:hypothetical protein [Acidobacteriota bacterium]